MTIEEAYQILGLQFGASHEEVRAAYRRRARETHPDAGGSAQEFIRVQAAYEILCKFQGMPKEGYDIPIPQELRKIIDQLMDEYLAEIARQRENCRAYMFNLRDELIWKVNVAPREKLAKFNQYFRQKWNSTIRELCRSVNSSCNQVIEKYENWFDDSMKDVHKQIQIDRFNHFIRSRKYFILSALPFLLGIVLAIMLHDKNGGWFMLTGFIVGILSAGIMALNSYMGRFSKPRRVETLDIAPFIAGRNDFVSYSSEVIREDIRAGRVAGVAGFILGDILTRGMAGPIIGGLIGWGAVDVASRIVNPTAKIKAEIISELDKFILQVTPELEQYITQAQQGVYNDLREKIIRNYKSRVQKMATMIADSANTHVIGP